MEKKQKFIFLGGGVASGIGKGHTVSYIAYLLQKSGYNISIIKINPYMNLDQGSIDPREEGEVFILSDGEEVHLDFGHYERFLNINLTADHNITSGKIFQQMLKKDRVFNYNAIYDDIILWIQRVGKIPVKEGQIPDIVLVQLGGTIGDMENAFYYESLRKYILLRGKENTIFIFLTYVLQLKNGEFKTKACQNSLKQLLSTGITPDLILARSDSSLPDSILQKIAQSGNLKGEFVMSMPDYKQTIHEIALLLEKNRLNYYIQQKLQLGINKADILFIQNYISYYNQMVVKQKEIRIGVVGINVANQNTYLSLEQALKVAKTALEMNLKIVYIDVQQLLQQRDLEDLDGMIVTSYTDQTGFERCVEVCTYARVHDIPILGICGGFQAQIVEFCRNVLLINDSASIEFKDQVESQNWVIQNLQTNEIKKGAQKTTIKEKSLAYQIYRKQIIYERQKRFYDVNYSFIQQIESQGMTFSGRDETGESMEILELDSNNFYLGVQFFPELQSRYLFPSPIYLAFLLSINKKLRTLLIDNDINEIQSEWNKKFI